MRAFLLLFSTAALWAQQASVAPQSPAPAGSAPLLSSAESNQLITRVSQLIESTAASIPGLGRASTAISETAKTVANELQITPNNAASTYSFLEEARAYLALTDALPKPYPLAPTAQRQFLELRDSVERLEQHFRALLERQQVDLHSPDPDNLRRYSEANDKVAANPSKSSRMVFMGDSITDFWRLNEYFPGREFINRGISGQTTSQMLGRFKADVIDLHPRAVLLLGGTNDIARGTPLRTIEGNIAMMADLCRQNGIHPVIASVLPVSDYHKAENPRYEMTKTHPPASIFELNKWIAEYCRTQRFVYADYWAALKNQFGLLPGDVSDDGLHPNGKGYRIMAPVAMRAIDQALNETSPQQQPPAKKRRFGVFSTQ